MLYAYFTVPSLSSNIKQQQQKQSASLSLYHLVTIGKILCCLECSVLWASKFSKVIAAFFNFRTIFFFVLTPVLKIYYMHIIER